MSKRIPWRSDAVVPHPGWNQVATLLAASLMLLGQTMTSAAQPPAVDAPSSPATPTATPNAPQSGTLGDATIKPAVPAPSGVEEVKPEVLYLQDKNGNLLPVPDLRLEEYQRLFNQHRGLVAPDPPRFILQGCVAKGQVEGDRAVFQVEFQIQTTDQARSDAWLRVPLRLNQLVLRGPAKYVGTGRQFIEFQASGDGYVCWLQAEKNTDHRVTLTLTAQLNVVGGTTRLQMETPQVPSHIELRVPEPGVEAFVSRQNANILRAPRPSGTGTELVLDGLGGEVQLSWRAAPDKLTASPPRLDATGAIRVTVERLGQISYEAQLRIRSFGGSVDAFRVRLPPRMNLVPLDQPGYRVVELEETSEPAATGPAALGSAAPESAAPEETSDAVGKPPDASGDRGRLVEIRLSSATSNDISVRLLLERMPADRETDDVLPDDPVKPSWLEVGSLIVEGAVRQRGYIDFAVEGEFSLDWRVGEGISRRDDIPEAIRQQRVVARFEYFRQPCSLKVQLRRKEKRIRVEPTYELRVGGGQVQLKAVLKCRVSGESAFRLQTDFSQWIVDSVDRGQWGTPDGVLLDQVAPLEVPVADNGMSLAEGFTITVHAHRDFMANAGTLTVPLPKPQQATLARASIVVNSLENVDLKIESLEQQGLVLEPLAGGSDRVHRFREQTTGAVESLVFDLRVQPRLVALTAESTVVVGDDQIEVDQRLNYEILYEPLPQLRLQIKRSLLSADSKGSGRNLAVAWDDQPLTLELPGNEFNNAEFVTVTAALPEPAVGSHLLTVKYLISGPVLQRDDQTSVQVPLVIPASGVVTRLAGNNVRLEFAGNLEVESTNRGWHLAEGPAAPATGTGRLDLVADVLLPSITFQARGVKRPLSKAPRVPLAWLQTLMTRTDRLDRFSFRIAQASDTVRIQLPPGARGDGLRVAVDRQPAAEVLIDDFGRVIVPLGVPTPESSSGSAGEHVVELWYWFDGRDAANREMTLDPPVIEGAEPAERTYWQVVVPGDEHLVVAPRNVTPELTWSWNGFYWGRQANLTQKDLETLVGGLQQNALPSAMNKYLFMSFGPLQPLRLVLGSRHLLLLSASGVVLIGGLLILYQPWLRHPALLLLAAVLLVGVGLWVPELTLLLGQAAGLGLLLFLMARLLDWALGGRRRRTAGLRSLQVPDSRTIEVPFSKPESAATTATARMAVQLSDTDSR